MAHEETSICRLVPAQADAYRALMLRAYADPDGAFTATVAERESLPLDWWRARLVERADATEMVFGALQGACLAGVAGLRLQQRPRTRHKAFLFGMAVEPAFRRRGIGTALVSAVLEQAGATPGIRLVQLTASETNSAAIGLYRSCGFSVFGTEPQAIQVGGRFIPLVHMWRSTIGPAAGATS